MSVPHNYLVTRSDGTKTLYENALLYSSNPDFISIVYGVEKTALISFSDITEIRIVK